jgi:predicted nucleic acid-binding protein
VTGSLGLLGRAKRLGLIPDVASYVKRLSTVGVHYHPELIRRFMESTGEVVLDEQR